MERRETCVSLVIPIPSQRGRLQHTHTYHPCLAATPPLCPHRPFRAVTLGLVLALEAPEPDVMERPPRLPTKPLLDGFTTWRTFYVTVILVAGILGNFQWSLVMGQTQREASAAAMTFLIVAQGVYALNCRFVSRSVMWPSTWVGNAWLVVAIFVNAALQCFLVYTPGVQDVWDLDDMNGTAWGRVILLAVGVFLFVEAEKAVGPRYVHPVLGPPFEWLRAHTPSLRHWLLRALLPISSAAHGAPAAAAESVRTVPIPQFEPLPAPVLPGPELHLGPSEEGAAAVAEPVLLPDMPRARVSTRRLPAVSAEAASPASARASLRQLPPQSPAEAAALRRSARQLAVMDDLARVASSRRVLSKDWSAPLHDGDGPSPSAASPRQFEALAAAAHTGVAVPFEPLPPSPAGGSLAPSPTGATPAGRGSIVGFPDAPTPPPPSGSGSA